MKYIQLIFLVFCQTFLVAQSVSLPGHDIFSENYMVAYQTRTGPTNFSSESMKKRNINSTKKMVSSRTLKRANRCFEKMWFYKAAQLYDKALTSLNKNISQKVLQRAGDAHFYNRNMKRASYWYGLLLKKYGNVLTSPYLFRYAQALKGTGADEQADQILRRYHQSIQTYGTNDPLETFLYEDSVNNAALNRFKYQIRSLDINSKNSDFAPVMANDDILVFSSSRDSSFLVAGNYRWNERPFLDLYQVPVDSSGYAKGESRKLSKKVNTKYHEAAACFSPNGDTLYFTRNNYRGKLVRGQNGINHLKIYRAINQNGRWEAPEEVSFNSDRYSTGHPVLSPDGKKMFFVSDMPGSLGKTDIYEVEILKNGTFSKPRNLGPQINTIHRELFPYFDGSSLFFTSEGHSGYGGLDIFQSNLEPNGQFKKVVNLGRPLNSRYDDMSYIENANGASGYFASNRPGGQGDDDIYHFQKGIDFSRPTAIIEGVANDSLTQQPLNKTTVELVDESGKVFYRTKTDIEGFFQFKRLEPSINYLIRFSKEPYQDYNIKVRTKGNNRRHVTAQMQLLNPLFKKEDGITKLRTEAVFFDFDSSEVRPDAGDELDQLATIMKSNMDITIKIESHTDTRGSASYNQLLSERRASATKNYLVSKGISSNRILEARGYGEEAPKVSCGIGQQCSEVDHQKNRRSEITVLSM